MPPQEAPLSDAEESPYTAWHHLLVQAMESLIDRRLLTILAFHKLGTLPIEADAILLLKEKDGPELAALVPDFDFMLRYLAHLTVLEYKGPDDVLTTEGFDTGIAYAMLAKRKHKIRWNRDVCLHFLYSYKETGFLESCQANGFRFIEVEPGVLRCDLLPLRIYLMDLVVLSDRRPDDLINLLSARHRRFVLHGRANDRRAAVLQHLYYTVFKEMMKMLMQDRTKDMPGAREVLQDIEEVRRRFIASLSPEERLEGMTPEERLEGMTPEERLEGMTPEERLEGMSVEDLRRLRALLEQRLSEKK